MYGFMVDTAGRKGLVLLPGEYHPEQPHGRVAGKRNNGVVDYPHVKVLNGFKTKYPASAGHEKGGRLVTAM